MKVVLDEESLSNLLRKATKLNLKARIEPKGLKLSLGFFSISLPYEGFSDDAIILSVPKSQQALLSNLNIKGIKFEDNKLKVMLSLLGYDMKLRNVKFLDGKVELELEAEDGELGF